MEHKNAVLIASIGFLVIGVLLGWLFWGSRLSQKNMLHRMYGDEMVMNNQNMHQSMNQMMGDMTSELKDKTGADFDAAFLEQMIPHHQGAIEMARMVLSTSKRPELIKLANDIISAQQKEIDMMRSWQRTWFGVQAQ